MMNRLENSFKKYLVRRLGSRWDVQSHEDKYSSGIADLSFGAKGVNGWIELKIIASWNGDRPVKPSKYTRIQINWLNKRDRKGGRCFVMVKVARDYFLLPAGKAKMVRSGMNKQGYMTHCLDHWDDSVDPDQLIDQLTMEKNNERICRSC